MAYCEECGSHHPVHGEVERGERYEARCQGGDGWVPIESEED